MTTINSKNYTLYELPGYQNEFISKDKQAHGQDSQTHIALGSGLRTARHSSVTRNGGTQGAFFTQLSSADQTQSSI